MGEPIRLQRRRQSLSSPSSLGFGQDSNLGFSGKSHANRTQDHRTFRSRKTPLDPIAKALARAQTVEQTFGPAGEPAIDAEMRQEFRKLLQPQDWEAILGISDPDEIARVLFKPTEIEQQRLDQRLRENEAGTHEIEATKNANKFMRALEWVLDGIGDIPLGVKYEEVEIPRSSPDYIDGKKTLDMRVNPREGGRYRPYYARDAGTEIMEVLEDANDAYTAHNAARLRYAASKGHESMEERRDRRERLGKEKHGWGPFSVTGKDIDSLKNLNIFYDRHGSGWNMLEGWRGDPLVIPFLQTDPFAADIIATLRRHDKLGTPEGRAKAKARRLQLLDQGVDEITAELTAWRERLDIPMVYKEGIIAGSDPTLIWGGALGAAKIGIKGIKVGLGIKASLQAMKRAKTHAPTLDDYRAVKEGVEQKIRRGGDDDFWEGKDVELDRHARNILEKDETIIAERARTGDLRARVIADSQELEELKARRIEGIEQDAASGQSVEDELMMRARGLRAKPESFRRGWGPEDRLTNDDLLAVDDIMQEWKLPGDIFEDIPEDLDGAANYILSQRQAIIDIKQVDADRLDVLENDILRNTNLIENLELDEAKRLTEIKDEVLTPSGPQSRFWDENPALLSQLTDEAMEQERWNLLTVNGPSSNKDLLARNKVGGLMPGARGPLGTLRRLISPQSDIDLYPVGSTPRVVLESKLIQARAVEEGDAHLELIKQQLRSLGEMIGFPDPKAKTTKGARRWYGAKRTEDRFIFEVGVGRTTPEKVNGKWTKVDRDEGRLWGIVPRRGQKGRSLTIGDVFEVGPVEDANGVRIMSGKEHRNKVFAGMTDRQHDAIDMLQDLYRQWGKIVGDEGIDVNLLGNPQDGFSFVSRKVKGEATELVQVGGRARSHPGFLESRFWETMKEGVLEGKKYYSPLETMEMYGRAMYRMIAEKRMLDHLVENLNPDNIKSTDLKTVRPDVVSQYDSALKVEKAQAKAVRLLGEYAEGRILTKQDKKDILEGFGTSLGTELDNLWKSGKALEPESLVQPIMRALKGNTATAVRQALKGVSGSKKTVSRTDVKAALRALGADVTATEEEVIDNIIGKGLIEQKATHKKRARAIQMRMMETLNETEQRTQTAREVRAGVKEQLTTLKPGEAKPAKLNVVFKGEGAVKGANDIDDWLRTEGFKPLRFATDLNDAIRLMKTGFDFGVFFLQGLPLLFRDPETWGKAMATSLGAFVDDGVRARYIADNVTDITDFVKWGGHIGSTEITQSMERGGWFARLPMVFSENENVALKSINRTAQGIHKTGRRFASQYDTFLDVARFEMFKAMKPTWTNHGGKLEDLTDFINKLSGHSSSKAIGIGTTQRELESALFLFSPKYTRATAAIFLDMTQGGLKGAAARQAVGGLIVSQYALHMAISAAMGRDPNLTPGSGKWLKTEVPGVGHVGFGGKSNSLLNMSADLIKQAQKNPEGFMSWDLWSPETYENNSLLKRLRYQSSPVATSILNMVTGVDPIGRQLPDWEDIYYDDAGNWEFDTAALKSRLFSTGLRYLPFMVEGWYEAGPVGGFGEFVGAQVYPERSYEARDNLYDKYSKHEFNMSYNALRKEINFETQKAVLEQKYPDLRQAIQSARDDERNFHRNDERMRVRDTRDAAITHLAQGWEMAAVEFRSVGGTGREFREKFWEANRVYGAKVQALRKAHPELYADMDAYYEGKGDYNQTQAATNAFMDRLFSDETRDMFGNTDYAAIDRIKTELGGIFGPEVMKNVERNFTLKMQARAGGDAADPVILEFIESIEGLRRYWDVGRDTMSDKDWRFWLQYQNSPNPVKYSLREAKLPESGKQLSEVEEDIDEARAKLQEMNIDIDKWLVLFFGKEPLNPQNIS